MVVRALDLSFLHLDKINLKKKERKKKKQQQHSLAHIVRLTRLQRTCSLEGENTLLCLVFSFELHSPETVLTLRPMAVLNVIDMHD